MKQEIYALSTMLIEKNLISPRVVTHDRSLLKAKGRVWHVKDRSKGIVPRKPYDREADWGYSQTKNDWVFGYGIHLSVSATLGGPVLPFWVEVTKASQKGPRVFQEEFLPRISEQTEAIVADMEYDSQTLYEKSRQRLITPVRETRNWKTKQYAMSKERKARKELYRSRKGQEVFRLRGTTIEQLFNVIKNIFRIEPSWFFGQRYTEALVSVSVFAYQIFVAYALYHNLPLRRIQSIKPFLDRI